MSGVRAVGMRYQRLVAKAIAACRLGDTVVEQWFEFVDAGGMGWCQTDVLVVRDGIVFVLECKLTDVEEAKHQLNGLYMPVVQHVYRRPVKGVIVTRHLTRASDTDNVFATLREAVASPATAVLHWIGKGPIL